MNGRTTNQIVQSVRMSIGISARSMYRRYAGGASTGARSTLANQLLTAESTVRWRRPDSSSLDTA
jgi:hypothetical protein